MLRLELPRETLPREMLPPRELEPRETLLPRELEPRETLLPRELEPRETLLPRELEPRETLPPRELDPRELDPRETPRRCGSSAVALGASPVAITGCTADTVRLVGAWAAAGHGASARNARRAAAVRVLVRVFFIGLPRLRIGL